jgi:hypothetical protein
LWVGLSFFVLLCGAECASMLAATSGEFVYPLDDAYIHLALAKTFATTGVWGITPHQFAAASSSPVWSLLLAAAMAVAGVSSWPPLVLAAVFGAALLWQLDRIWRRTDVTPALRCVGLCLCTWLLPLPTLVLSGMEHPLHAWSCLLLAECVVGAVGTGVPGAGIPGSGIPGSGRRATFGALLLAPLVAATRFESAFLIAPAALLLWRHRGVRLALAFAVLAALPVLALGAWSWSQGSFFLPTSVVLKGGAADIPGLSAANHGVIRGIRALAGKGHVGAMFVATVAVWWWHRRDRASPLLQRAQMAAVAIALHAQFARFGWFFRYESYLLVLGWAAVWPVLLQRWRAPGRERWIARLLLVFLLAASAHRGLRAVVDPAEASRHTFQQNVQVGRFLREHVAGRGVAVNDIGAVSFLGEVPVHDLVGLADAEVARARIERRFDRRFVADLVARRGVDLVVVYESWFPGQIPAEWERLARWTVEPPFWEGTVSFFAPRPESAGELRAALAAYAARLPAGVRVH